MSKILIYLVVGAESIIVLQYFFISLLQKKHKKTKEIMSQELIQYLKE